MLVDMRYIPLLERLTETERKELIEWIRSKRPADRTENIGPVTVGYTTFMPDNKLEQALLEDLEGKDD